MKDPWSPEQYERFRDERARPFFDLAALVRRTAPPRVVDLGCGTGELTRDLHRALGAQETLGIDNSEAMLAKSAAFQEPGLRFELGDLATWHADGCWDVVFSNAALHWTHGHDELVARLAGALAPGGQLAFQVPANDDHPSHVTGREVAAEAPFREALGGFEQRLGTLAPEAYSTLLDRLGFKEQRVRLEVYAHTLRSREGVVEWVRGTMLTAYERRLSPELFAQFLARYEERLLPKLEATKPYFYPFKRILVWGARSSGP